MVDNRRMVKIEMLLFVDDDNIETSTLNGAINKGISTRLQLATHQTKLEYHYFPQILLHNIIEI